MLALTCDIDHTRLKFKRTLKATRTGPERGSSFCGRRSRSVAGVACVGDPVGRTIPGSTTRNWPNHFEVVVPKGVAGSGTCRAICSRCGATGDVTANDDTEWHHILDVNVVGIARVMRAALPHLRRSSTPAVVNTVSAVAFVGVQSRALCSASKGAVHALTLAMAADYVGEGIRVNAVAPGTTETPWVGRSSAPLKTRGPRQRRCVDASPTSLSRPRLLRPAGP